MNTSYIVISNEGAIQIDRNGCVSLYGPNSHVPLFKTRAAAAKFMRHAQESLALRRAATIKNPPHMHYWVQRAKQQ